MNQTTNEKQIVRAVIQSDAPHLAAVEEDIIGLVRNTFTEIGKEVQQGNKVLVKNFGSFQLKERNPRRRYDTGLKAAVITEPKEICEFIQSNNIFRDGKDN
jgi:nucleoid DNA-binding protein